MKFVSATLSVLSVLLFCTLGCRLSAAPSAPPAISDIIYGISGGEIQEYAQEMENFGTRFVNSSGGLSAETWISRQFERCGFLNIEESEVADFVTRNVCAILYGEKTPEKVYILGAHYDSIAVDLDNAPGADDNASGTAGMLAVAKAMAKYRFESTIVFCAYTGEELGLFGSRTHARALADSETNVAGMINLDMIGYKDPKSELDINVIFNDNSRALRDIFAATVALYLPGVKQIDGELLWGSSDHESFWRYKFPAILLFEDTKRSSPFIHKKTDRVGKSFNSPELAEQIARAAAATLAILAVPLGK